jgi:NOL1/NOP2/sun family putative RNA methylase
MSLPQALITSLQNIKGFDENAFGKVHQSAGQVTSVRINPFKLSISNCQLPIHQPVPWSSFGYYLKERPSFTFDPLFHAGCYYVQEASSMFLEQALKQAVDLSAPLKILDLCAAPGGKSTLIQSLISFESLLVSNEVIKSRTNVLKENIIKWGSANVIITNNDPKHFSKLQGFFDVLVIDAPCSGSGLFRKDPEAINEWSEENVMLCCGRQKRIIADAFASLKENGVLIYSTCSYSKEEDEDIADWLIEELNMESVKLKIEDSWRIIETQSEKKGYGYRFFPDKVKGEGFYLACFRKLASTEKVNYKTIKPEQANATEKGIVSNWLKPMELSFFKTPFIYALPCMFLQAYSIIKNALNVHYAGVTIGEIMKERLVPAHSLALSFFLKEEVPAVNLDYNAAIRYLQKR